MAKKKIEPNFDVPAFARNLPNFVIIDRMKYSITWTNILERDGNLGTTNQHLHQIELDNSQDASAMKTVALHEIMHACMSRVDLVLVFSDAHMSTKRGSDVSEYAIRSLQSPLRFAMIDNPAWFKWIGKE